MIYLSRGWHLLSQCTLYLVNSHFNTLIILCCCARARLLTLLGLATHSNNTSDYKMIYRHGFTGTQFIPCKTFVRPCYSTTHTQVLITHYVVKHLHYWTQDVANELSTQDYHQSQFIPSEIDAREATQNILFPPIWDVVFPKRHHLSRIKLHTKDYQQLQNAMDVVKEQW